jgi:hypothetical protein
MCNSSADTLSYHILVQNWILELHSIKNKIRNQIKCGAKFKNSTFHHQANHKGICEEKKTLHTENCKYVAH